MSDTDTKRDTIHIIKECGEWKKVIRHKCSCGKTIKITIEEVKE